MASLQNTITFFSQLSTTYVNHLWKAKNMLFHLRGVSAVRAYELKSCQPFFLKKTIFRRKIMVFQKKFLIKIISKKS